MDGHKKARGDPNYLSLWKPVAPAGYVSMGLLAGTGGKEPNMAQVSADTHLHYNCLAPL